MKAIRTVTQLAPDSRNPRKISPDQRAALKKSLTEFGDLSGFVFNRRTRRLISGHQRRTVIPPDSAIVLAEKLRKPDSLGTVARGHVRAGDDRIPYREVDWPEPKAKAAMIAANQHGGDFTRELLAELLNELEAEGTDLDLTGYFGEALLEARKQAYDSLSRLSAIIDADQPSGENPAPSVGDAPKTSAPAPASNQLLAFTLTAAESGRWSEVKKHLAERDDKRAFLALLTSRLDP